MKANRTRNEFLANVSHELRTPMNAIIGMTQIALEDDLPDDVRDYIATANEAAHSLLNLLNDILDFSKIESGKFTISEEPFSLSDTVDETVRTLSTSAFAKGLELVCEMPKDLPTRMLGDPTRLRQILTNLLSNAIKFTEQGEVVLRVEVVRRWPNEIRLRFSVTDTGLGIPAEMQRHILEPFAQADSSTTRVHGGTGLGLAICSELLRMMGGRLSLRSAVGNGSTFSFRLSFDLLDQEKLTTADGLPIEQLQQLPVLVVDDNETNRRIISETLQNWSMKPVLAKDAEQAIGILSRAAESEQSFPLVIVDALMPGTDGYELSAKIAEMNACEESPVILMVSSTDRREFRDREEEANVSVFLQKPVTQSDLMDAVMRSLDVKPPGKIDSIDAAEGELSLEPLSILLAEDTPANQKVAMSVLKKRGHSVSVASNGREAVELFKRDRFDVILMDVQMPILDGFQATAAIRDIEKDTSHSTPIIAMTAHAMRGDREKCLEAGMDAYIAKPLDVKQLLGLVESLSEDRMGRQVGQTSGPNDKSGSGAKNLAGVIDFDGAMKRLGNDEDLYREFVGFYDEDARKLLSKIEQSAEAGNATALRHTAHSLKGLAANLGAVEVVEASLFLEKAGADQLFEELPKRLADLRTAMQRADQVLSKYV